MPDAGGSCRDEARPSREMLAVAVEALDPDRVRTALTPPTRRSRDVGTCRGLGEVRAGLGMGADVVDKVVLVVH